MGKRIINDITKKRLSSLVSKSITGKSIDTELFRGMSKDEWKELSFISRVHTVDAIVYNEILSFDSILPTDNTCLNMLAVVESTKKLNRKIYDIINRLGSVYNSMDIEFVVFKGPVCGVNYKEPLLRCVGDIDVYFHKHSDFVKANEWAKKESFVYHVDEIKLGQWTFELDNIKIEHHNDMTFFEKRKYNVMFKNILEKEFERGCLQEVNITDKLNVKTFSDDVTYLYVFLHLFYHFIHGGIGLRQFMDWIYLNIEKHNKIDKKQLAEYCKDFEIEYPMSLFARVAVDYFDIAPEIFPFNVPETSLDSILVYDDIMECGNFGILATDYWSGKWTGRFHKFIKTMNRIIKIHHISPEYSTRVPFAMLMNRIYLSVFK